MLEGETSYVTISTAMRSTYLPILISLFTIYIGYTSFYDKTPFLIFDVVKGTNNLFNKSWNFYLVRIGIALNLLVALFNRIRSTFEGYFLWRRPHMK